MSKLFLLLSFSVTLFCASLGAQCNQYFQYADGQKFEYTSYNKKGKLVSRDHHKVTTYTPTDDGFAVQIKTTHFDKNGLITMRANLDAECADGVYTFDVRNLVNEDMMKSFQGMEVRVEGTALEVPNALQVGQELPGGECRISAGSEGVSFLNLTIQVDDRKVTGKESVTTEAGTFDCVVIEQQITSKMIVKATYIVKEYLAAEYGAVRVETYNQKGKFLSTRDLTSVSK